ncbi:MAG: hypothetical protein B7X04_04355 [Parcubacteria group bacterium 21-54-25]|nr:MAG: hypothetical protein B7X04_04355 [Parcubacteria group bacterium 21-54-25]HQU08211.1 hypothetical protein [Candidatus Paceibacterota bacterium]
MYRDAISTKLNSVQAQKLWLEYVEGWSEKQNLEKKKDAVLLSIDDIRFLIQGLPEPHQSQSWDRLRDISDMLHLYGDPSLHEASNPQVPSATPVGI